MEYGGLPMMIMISVMESALMRGILKDMRLV
jgi:hypothetical protein